MKKLMISLAIVSMFSAGSLTAMAKENLGDKVESAIKDGANKTSDVVDEIKKGADQQADIFKESADQAGHQISGDAKDGWDNTKQETKKLSNELNEKIQKDL